MEKKTNLALRILDHVDTAVTTLIIAFLFLDVVLQVLTRIIPGNAISWTNELGEMLLCALIWFGLSAAVRSNSHIGFDLFVSRLSPRGKRIMGAVNTALFIIYLVILGYLTWGLMQRYIRFNQATPILRINYFWVRLPMVIGCAAGVVRLLIKEYRILTGKERMYERTIHAE